MEQNLTTVPNTELATLSAEQMTVTEQAKAMTVASADQYTAAGSFLVNIKGIAKKIEAYWAEPKAKAYSVWKDLCGKESDLITPLKTAETTIKAKMGDYDREQRRLAEALAAEQRRREREEAERMAAMAQEAESSGDSLGAELFFAQALNAESMVAKTVPTVNHAATGVSTRSVWKARIINPALVPVEIGGILIRPIDESALNNYARLTKGAGSIPGVEMYEDTIVSARGR